jgi:hypothetical protein
MNSACSDHTKEARGKAGRRKLPSVGVSDVMRWFGRWPESAVGGRKKKVADEREMLEGEEREGHGRCSTTGEELG